MPRHSPSDLRIYLCFWLGRFDQGPSFYLMNEGVWPQTGEDTGVIR